MDAAGKETGSRYSRGESGMSCPARSTRLRTKSTVRSPIVFSGRRCSCLLDARPVFALQHPLHARKQFVHIERFAEILVSPSSIRLLIFSACNMLMINAWECSCSPHYQPLYMGVSDPHPFVALVECVARCPVQSYGISYEGAPFEIPLLCIHDPSGHDHSSNHVGVFCAVVLKGSPCLEGIAK